MCRVENDMKTFTSMFEHRLSPNTTIKTAKSTLFKELQKVYLQRK